MTTPPTAPAAPDITTIDQALADRCQTSGDYLAGLITRGMLESVSRPAKLPELLFDGDPALIRAVWEAGLAVGYRAGETSARPTWVPDALDHSRAALEAAGYAAMGGLARRSASIHPPRHPADTEAPAVDSLVRDGGHP